MTPRATGGDAECVSKAEVQDMLSKGIDNYDDRVSKPRHAENQKKLDEILDGVKEVQNWKTGWEAILKYRDKNQDHRRDWVVPILAAVLAAAAGVLLTLVFSKPMRSSVKNMVSSDPAIAQAYHQ